jgi:hypothetical protein
MFCAMVGSGVLHQVGASLEDPRTMGRWKKTNKDLSTTDTLGCAGVVKQ